MTTLELLSLLRNRAIKIWVEDGQLRYNAPKGALTPELRAELAAHKADVIAFLSQINAEADAANEPGLVTGPVPMTPRPITFPGDAPIDLDNYLPNAVILMEAVQRVDIALLKTAVRQIMLHHDALRLRLVETASGWQQYIAEPDETIPCEAVDLSQIAPEDQRAAFEAAVARFRSSLSLSAGPLFRVVLFDLGEQPQRLLVIFHHLAADQFSLPIVFEDLQTVYGQLSRGEAVRLLPKTTSVKRWAELLVEYAHSSALLLELDYWRGLPWSHIRPLPVDYPDGRGSDTEATTATVTAALSPAETQVLLRTLPRTNDIQVFHILLAILAEVFRQWTGEHTLFVESIYHGRMPFSEEIDLSRTVGWVTSHTPILLDLRETGTLREALQAVKEQVQAIPNMGIGYELLRYVNTDPEIAGQFRSYPREEVMFGYYPEYFQQHASVPSLFYPVQESIDAGRNLKNRRYKLLDIRAMIVDGSLVVSWSYSTKLYQPATIEALAGNFIAITRAFISAATADVGRRDASSGQAFAAPQTPVETVVAQIWAEVLGLDQVGRDDNFFDLGGHSLLLAQVQSQLRQRLGYELPMIDLFRLPTISALAEFISEQQGAAAADQQPLAAGAAIALPQRFARPEEGAIAIIGMAGRFPGARTIEAFWQNLREGVEAITFFSDQELLEAGVEPAVLRDPAYVKVAAIIDDIELFDASFFGYTPREAEVTDPQQRLFLECAWEALERAGYAADRFPGAIGVFAGASLNTYMFQLHANSQLNDPLGRYQMAIGNAHDHLATRVSYKLNLRGPSLTVQTACSTSLVAVHMARQSLLDGESDIALAGGVSLRVPQKEGLFYQEGGIISPDGHCRTFDAQAQGTVTGSGVGVVVLKRLADALADGDQILAVIRGSAINNDGAQKVGYTAPSITGQAAVINKALTVAGFAPETVGYIEAHGTGTPLGDPIEIAALTQAFRSGTDRAGFCAIGSVKSNIGHLDAAAGVAGLIKTTLALEHYALPATLHFEQPNPQIDFAASPFYVNSTYRAWPAEPTPRRAGVSSFGIGGTNAHVALEEAPARPASGPSRPWQLLLISARTNSAVEAAIDNLAGHLKAHPDLNLADVAYTLQAGRRAFSHRRMLLCADLQDAVRALESRDPQRLRSAFQPPQQRPIAFMFSGQGTQYVNMARELYQTEPLFHEQIDRCCELLEPHLGLDLREVLYPAEPKMEDGGWRMEDRDSAILHPPSSILDQTQYAQPALFVIEYALTQLWMAWGIQPQVMIGHSIGEYVAACLAGVFSLEDALKLVAARGRMMQQVPAGAMLAISLPEDQVRPLLDERLDLAAINGPAHCVVAGPADAVSDLERRLTAQDVSYRRLHTSHAFHSAMMDPVMQPFTDEIRALELRVPRIRYVSNLTGTWITDAEATDPHYWAAHLRQAVRFADGIGKLLHDPNRVLVELGPGQTLSTLARQHPDRKDGQIVLTTLRHPRDQQPDVSVLLNSLGQLWLAGVPIDWTGFYAAEQRRRVLLPTYPFERQRYWIAGESGIRQARAGKKAEIAEWFYRPVWQPGLPASPPDLEALLQARGPWLVFADQTGLGARLIDHLIAAGCHVVRVRAGDSFTQHSATDYTIRPAFQADYQQLLAGLETEPRSIVHLWSCEPTPAVPLTVETFAQAQQYGLYSLLSLIKALSGRPIAANLAVWVITQHTYRVTGGEALAPESMPLAGASVVVAQEHPDITCRSIDIDRPAAGSWQEQRLIRHILAECAAPSTDLTIAYRHTERWSRTFEPLRLNVPTGQIGLRRHGVYLITGGLGSIGLVLAEHLARTVQARLILTTHSAFPPADEWAAWLDTHAAEHPISQKIRRIQSYESLGAEVLVLQADAADEAQMHDVRRQIQNRFGQLHGIIYAAGTSDSAGFAPIQSIERNQFELHFKPKVYGLLNLELVFGDQELDFCMLFSSLASILGGLGFVAYAAANSFIDAFVQHHNQRSPMRWTSVNWDTWRVNENQRADLGMSIRNFAMTREEALQAFERAAALAPLAPQLINSTGDLAARFDQWVGRAERRRSTPATEHQRQNLPRAYVPPSTPIEAALARVWSQVLGHTEVGVHDNFFALGGDSLIAARVVAAAKYEGLSLPLQDLLTHQTIAELAPMLTIQPADVPQEQALVVGPLPLTPSQHRFLQFRYPDEHHFNAVSLLEIAQPIDPTALEQALQHVLMHHDGLRQAFYATSEGWTSAITDPPAAPPFSLIDLSAVPAAEQAAAITEAATRLQKSFTLSESPLVRVALFHCGADQPQRLLIVIHHLITDAIANDIWMTHLRMAYEQILRGAEVSLPPKATSVRAWIERLAQHVRSGALQPEVPYWLADARRHVAPLPIDYPQRIAQNIRESERNLTSALSVEETQTLLRIVQASMGRELNVQDILLTALVQTCAVWTGRQQLLVLLVNHGRLPYLPDLDLSSIVSFTAFHFPMLLDITGTATPGAAVEAVKSQLRAVPGHGIGYSLLRYLNDDAELVGQLRGLPEPDIFFNYLGRQGNIEQAWSKPARESPGPTHAPQQSRLRSFYCRAQIAGDRLLMTWLYSEHLHARATVESLDQTFMEELRTIIRALAPQADGGSPSATEYRRLNLSSAYAPPSTPIEVALARVWSQVLGHAEVGIHDNFFALGGDSLIAARVVAAAKHEGLSLPLQDLLAHQTIAELAPMLAVQPAVAPQEQALVVGPLLLTTDQGWYLSQEIIDPRHRFNAAWMLTVVPGLDVRCLKEAVAQLLRHHDALRSRFVPQDGHWRARIVEPDDHPPFEHVDLAQVSSGDLPGAIEQHADTFQGQLDLTDGPLVRVAYFDCGPERPGRLLLIAHHLVADGYSLPILLEDIHTGYQQRVQGQAIQLPPKTTSIQAWAEQINAYLQSPAMQAELAYWTGLPWEAVPHVPLDFPSGLESSTIESLRTVEAALGAAETQILLRYLPTIEHAQIADALVMALVKTIAHWTHGDWVEINMVYAGREVFTFSQDFDVSRTVGWLATSGILLLERPAAESPVMALRATLEQLRRIPTLGIGYHMLLFLSPDPQVVQRLAPLRKNEVHFNYLGQIQYGFPDSSVILGPAAERTGRTREPDDRDFTVLDGIAMIIQNQLLVRWTYSECLYQRETIEQLLAYFLGVLRALASDIETHIPAVTAETVDH